MTIKNISNQEIKGSKDWTPGEFNIRKYIFDKWRETCLSYGFSEYLTPLLEDANIYRLKSGEDLGGKELMVFLDQGGRELAIRPEMTPSVVRMVSKIYSSSPKPLRLFSVANFIRNEKPQRGRNREFWQLNCDIFGDNSVLSDLEILRLAIDLILSFNPPKDSFVLKINHRLLIDDLFDFIEVGKDARVHVLRLMDKFSKISRKELTSRMTLLGLNESQIAEIIKFSSSDNLENLIKNIPNLEKSVGFRYLRDILGKIEELSYNQYIKFDSGVIRGFDYYDGLVFEVFDNHPDNNRAMFGGGRYNGLAEIFGVKNFPAIGFAPGDETFKLFLEAWGVLPDFNKNNDIYFFPILSDSLVTESFSLADKLRKGGNKVELGFNFSSITKALEYANKKSFSNIIIFGDEEYKKGVYKVKNMINGEESERGI